MNTKKEANDQCYNTVIIIIIIIIIIKKGRECMAGESDIHPISPKTSAPEYQPINRKKRKGNRVEGIQQFRLIKKHWLCS